MALIQCPECGMDVSDKASSCIHCGYPLSQNQDIMYEINLIDIYSNDLCSRHRGDILRLLSNVTHRPLKEFNRMIYERCGTLVTGVSYDNAIKIQKLLNQYGITTDLSVSFAKTENNNVNVERTFYIDESKVFCPACKSTSITTGKRGFTILSGFIGSNKTINRCAKCGYSWYPK